MARTASAIDSPPLAARFDVIFNWNIVGHGGVSFQVENLSAAWTSSGALENDLNLPLAASGYVVKTIDVDLENVVEDRIDLYHFSANFPLNLQLTATANVGAFGSNPSTGSIRASMHALKLKLVKIPGNGDPRLLDDDFVSVSDSGGETFADLPSANADFDSDGDVDGADFLTWQRNYPLINGAQQIDGNATSARTETSMGSIWPSGRRSSLEIALLGLH